MPPILALFLCIVGVGYLLKLDRKLTPNVSVYLWLPTLWVLYCGSRPLGNWFGGGGDSEKGSGIDRLALSGMMAAAIYLLKRRRFSFKRAVREQKWLIAAYAFALISCFWSDHPFIAFKRWIRVFGSLLMVWVILTEKFPYDAVESVLRRAAYVLLPFSMLLIKYFLDKGVAYDRWVGTTMWVGVTTQKNSLGALGLISAFFLLWALHRRKQRGDLWKEKAGTLADFSILFLALWILKGPGVSYSATAAVSLFMGVAMYVFLVKISRRGGTWFNLVWFVAVPGILIGISIPIAGSTGVISGILEFLGRDTTFTGRTEIWEGILPTAWKNSLVGVGYGSYWINPPLRYPLNELTHAHNGYLNIFVELGFIGLGTVVAFLLSAFRQVQKALTREVEWAAFCAALLLILLFHNVTECSLLRASSFLWLIVLLFTALLPQLCRLPRRSRSGRAAGRVSTAGAGLQETAGISGKTAPEATWY